MKQFLDYKAAGAAAEVRVLGHFVLPSISNHFFPMSALQISLKQFSLILT